MIKVIVPLAIIAAIVVVLLGSMIYGATETSRAEKVKYKRKKAELTLDALRAQFERDRELADYQHKQALLATEQHRLRLERQLDQLHGVDTSDAPSPAQAGDGYGPDDLLPHPSTQVPSHWLNDGGH